MPAADLRILLAASETLKTSQLVGAAAALVLAFLAAFAVDRAFQRRGRRLAETITRGSLSREVDTRLNFIRRLIYATILLIGVALALSQFAGINRVAASVLASGAIAAAVIGFAAQRTLANFVAGVMLAITQPLRIGDWVTFEERHGIVEDVRLNFTVLRTPDDERIIVPNEKLASGVLVNHTLAVDAVGLSVEVWLAPHADADRAVQALVAETQCSVAVAEVRVDGVRLTVGGERVAPPEQAAREAELRARCLRRLRAEGLLPAPPA
jgi:small-conductance mechanosensitive channel